MDPSEPIDKWHLVFLTSVCHGMGTLIGWNMFITAKDYFVIYKLKDVPVYSHNFLAYMGWASQIPNVVFNWLNVFVNFGGNLTIRILWSLIIEIAIFVITIILAMIDTAGWPDVFFWLTMISVFLLNAFNAIFQNCVYGVTAPLPPKYMGGVLLGSNICGTLVVLLSWLSRSFDDLRTAAIYYFISGMFLLIVCFDTYLALPLNRFYRYYQKPQQRVSPELSDNANCSRIRNIPYLKICKQASAQLYNVFIIFFVTLAVYPAVISDIKPNNAGFLGDNFVMLTCFFTFNVTAMIGNISASVRQIPSPSLLIVFTTIRLLFIPLFLVCNYQVAGGRTMPVLITSDYMYWFMSALLGWSSGHGSSLGMMYISRMVNSEHAATAGMMGAAALVTGILLGLIFTRLCPIIVSL